MKRLITKIRPSGEMVLSDRRKSSLKDVKHKIKKKSFNELHMLRNEYEGQGI